MFIVALAATVLTILITLMPHGHNVVVDVQRTLDSGKNMTAPRLFAGTIELPRRTKVVISGITLNPPFFSCSANYNVTFSTIMTTKRDAQYEFTIYAVDESTLVIDGTQVLNCALTTPSTPCRKAVPLQKGPHVIIYLYAHNGTPDVRVPCKEVETTVYYGEKGVPPRTIVGADSSLATFKPST